MHEHFTVAAVCWGHDSVTPSSLDAAAVGSNARAPHSIPQDRCSSNIYSVLRKFVSLILGNDEFGPPCA